MKKILSILMFMVLAMVLTGCKEPKKSTSAKESQAVSRQQSQYAIGQPVPAFDWSLERHLLIELYKLRNAKVTTHSVWRSDYGLVEYDCPSMGYGMPYDTSLTNPLVATDISQRGAVHHYVQGGSSLTSIEQPEPNGIFASKNTNATWVICIGEAGSLEPHYVESKVAVFPYPVTVDYVTNRVSRAGATTVTISKD